MDVLEGAELQAFVSGEVRQIAKEVWPERVYLAAIEDLTSEVVDHGRGLVTSTVVGRSIAISVGEFRSGENTVRYERIDDRSRAGVRALLNSQLKAMETQIDLALQDSR